MNRDFDEQTIGSANNEFHPEKEASPVCKNTENTVRYPLLSLKGDDMWNFLENLPSEFPPSRNDLISSHHSCGRASAYSVNHIV